MRIISARAFRSEIDTLTEPVIVVKRRKVGGGLDILGRWLPGNEGVIAEAMKGMALHHIDRDPGNNEIANLRPFRPVPKPGKK